MSRKQKPLSSVCTWWNFPFTNTKWKTVFLLETEIWLIFTSQIQLFHENLKCSHGPYEHFHKSRLIKMYTKSWDFMISENLYFSKIISFGKSVGYACIIHYIVFIISYYIIYMIFSILYSIIYYILYNYIYFQRVYIKQFKSMPKFC